MVTAAIGASVLTGPVGPASASSVQFDNQKPYGRFGRPLAVDLHNTATTEAASGDLSGSALAAATTIGRYPSANWIGGQSPEQARSLVSWLVTSAASRHAISQLVLFDLPNRTCGRDDHFAPTTASSYRAWVRGVVAGLGRQRAIVVVEPDSLGLASCLPTAQRLERYALVKYAVDQVRAQGSWAYIDIGHSGWLSVSTAVDRLKASGIFEASGFSLNVSNFRPDAELMRYGTAISDRVYGRHFVIDSSRNGGSVSSALWCNPPHAGLGHAPTVHTGIRKLDAWLWIKNPGGSDGTCNGGPAPGGWFASYAQGLVANAHLH